MDVVWDPAKAKANERRHGVRFSDVEPALRDPRALTIEDSSSQEQRFVTMGSDGLARILVVVYAYRGDTVRLISARRASPGEVQSYEKGI
jgi:uncharacterized DUF497 family protein